MGSEGSETTKLGTDEQEPDMRLLGWMSKHIIVKSETLLSQCRSSRPARNREKPRFLAGQERCHYLEGGALRKCLADIFSERAAWGLA